MEELRAIAQIALRNAPPELQERLLVDVMEVLYWERYCTVSLVQKSLCNARLEIETVVPWHDRPVLTPNREVGFRIQRIRGGSEDEQ